MPSPTPWQLEEYCLMAQWHYAYSDESGGNEECYADQKCDHDAKRVRSCIDKAARALRL